LSNRLCNNGCMTHFRVEYQPARRGRWKGKRRLGGQLIKFRASVSAEDEPHKEVLARYLQWHEGCTERHGTLMGVAARDIHKVADALAHFYGSGARIFKKFRDGAMGYDCEVTISSIRAKHPWDICNHSILFQPQQRAHTARRVKVASFHEGDVVGFMVNGEHKWGVVAYVNQVTCTVATPLERTRLLEPHLLTKMGGIPSA